MKTTKLIRLAALAILATSSLTAMACSGPLPDEPGGIQNQDPNTNDHDGGTIFIGDPRGSCGDQATGVRPPRCRR